MNRQIRFLLLVLSLIICDSQISAQQWTWKFPAASSNFLYAIRHISGESWITAGEQGVIFKTTDNGSSWRQIQNPAGNRDFTDLYAVNGSVIYAAANRSDEIPHHITIKSTDGGESWFEIASVSDAYFYKLQFLTEQTGYALAGERIYKTTNGGQSWSAPVYISTVYSISDFHFINETDGFAAGAFGAFAKTTDGGATWTTSVSPFSSGLYTVWFISSTTGFVAGLSNQIGKTTDGGATWSETTLASATAFNEIQFSGNTGIAAGFFGMIYRTTNAGQTWLPESVPGSAGEYILSVSMNGTGTAMAAGQYGAIYRRTTEPVWYEVNPRRLASATSITWPTVQKGFVTLSSGHLMSTSDSGSTWNEQPLIEGVYATKAGFFAPNHGVVFTWSDTFFYTSNGGTSWIKRVIPSGATPPNAASFPGLFTGYAAGNNGSILKTTDGGLNWVHSRGPDGASIHDIHFINETTGFITSAGNGIHKTTDGGETWVRKAYYPALSISFPTPATGYAAGSGSYVLKTTDGGENWVSVTVPNTALNSYSTLFVTDKIGYISGPHIYKTTDGGINWFAERDGMGYSDRIVFDIDLSPDGSIWAVSSSSGIHKLNEPPAAGGTLILPVTQAVAGDKVPIDVFIDVPLNRNFLSAQFSFNGYGSNLIFDSLSASGSISSNNDWYTSVNSADNTIRFAASGTFPHRGAGILARLWFTVAPGASGILPLNFLSALIDNGAATTDTMNGSISLLVPNYGDVDLNGFVQAYDASLVLQYSAGIIPLNLQQKLNANVTTDATISAFDASVILRYITGLVTSLPYSGSSMTPARIFASGPEYIQDGTARFILYANQPENIFSLDTKISMSGSGWEADSISFPALNSLVSSKKTHDAFALSVAGTSTLWNNQAVPLGTVYAIRRNHSAEPPVLRILYRFNEEPFTEYLSPGVTGLQEENTITEFTLRQNYPNPFNPSTRITYTLPADSYIRAEVYDNLGRVVSVVDEGWKTSGTHTLQFEAKNLASGIYHLRIAKGDETRIIKMIYLK